MTHTPGPWKVDTPIMPSGLPYGYTIKANGKSVVNQTSHTKRDGYEALANARLIAAAPELLAVCQAMLELCLGFNDADQYEEDEEPIVAPIIRQARAAITKATNDS